MEKLRRIRILALYIFLLILLSIDEFSYSLIFRIDDSFPKSHLIFQNDRKTFEWAIEYGFEQILADYELQ